MRVLILGGTGAIGKPLVDRLARRSEEVFITSRDKHYDNKNVHYIQGNAKNNDFLSTILQNKYDVIVDFMVYGTEQFRKRLNLFLDHTDQYVFLSSSRVYAESESLLVEQSPRLLEISKDQRYLLTDEYALAKAREEDLLYQCGRTNWTIIRPYITYNDNRLQLGMLEKELWLKRALEGKSIIFPRDIAEKNTTLTYGLDVSILISKLVGNNSALGKTYHITSSQSVKWGEILELYVTVLERETGKKPRVVMPESSAEFLNLLNKWQIKYDRLYNRIFNNNAILFMQD